MTVQKLMVFYLDVHWSPALINKDGTMDRKYLRLSYPESSFMEYPKEWEDRMSLWDEIMKQV